MATLEQIQNRVKKLQAQADALIAKKVQEAVDQIRGLMLKYGLTTADIEPSAKVRRETKTPGRKAIGATAVSIAKYRDPHTGATWTGHGRAPAWIANAKDRSKFLADGVNESATASTQKSSTKKSAAAVNGAGHTGQPKGKQPAKYINRKTGATWSGRGPAPAWLAGAKDRTKFLIESDAESTPSVPKEAVAQKIGRKNAVAAKKGVAKKAVAAKKSTGKKAVAKKALPTPRLKNAATKKAVARKRVTGKAKATVADVVATSESPVEQAVA
ncbi:H-NS family nucleoid-associated regulatory protein [Paraburkholderia sp. IMGN_8]|uniref:H-NS histone family protein n=1 Tax=Paraburkholderia sp. IMGN_8 TaxID=3136564 RepID=UPI003100C58B